MRNDGGLNENSKSRAGKDRIIENVSENKQIFQGDWIWETRQRKEPST